MLLSIALDKNQRHREVLDRHLSYHFHLIMPHDLKDDPDPERGIAPNLRRI